MGQEKSNHVHALTLCFRDSLKEEQVTPSITFFLNAIVSKMPAFMYLVPAGCG